MFLKEIVDKSIQFFKDKKIPSARLDAEILISKALNLKRIDLYLKFEQPLSEQEISKCREFIKRRSLGEPVAYIINEKDFFGHTFYVDKNVLIPRPETELLVEAAAQWAFQYPEQELKILDLGTGSGCIALSLLKKLPKARATLVDISVDAIEVAKQNAVNLGVLNRCDFLCSNATDLSFKNIFDIVIANPPYISVDSISLEENVKKYEPSLALFAEENGTSKIKAWAKKSKLAYLAHNGWMGFEIGHDQGQEILSFFQNELEFPKSRIIKDYAGHDRHVVN